MAVDSTLSIHKLLKYILKLMRLHFGFETFLWLITDGVK